MDTPNTSISWDQYNVTQIIGSGAYGVVYKAIEKATGKIVALKVISLQENWLPLLAEVNMVIGLAHETIVNYWGWFFHEGKLVIVMEHCDGGNLTDVIKKLGGKLTPTQIAAVFHGLLRSLEYIHSTGRIHRDIKSGNLLLTTNGDVKLCDFGVSSQIEKQNKATTVIGSPYWMAPEVIDSSGHDMKADIWSAGITALELYNGSPPNIDMNALQVLLYIPLNPPPQCPSDAPEDFKQMLSHMLVKDPAQRYSADQLLQTDFIKRVNAISAREIIRDMVTQANLANEYDEEEQEEDEEDEYEYEEEEEEDEADDGFDEPISAQAAATIMYGDGTFVPMGTMVVSGESDQPSHSGLTDWKPQFIDTPQPSSKLKKAQKRHFKNFSDTDLTNMLKGIKALAVQQLGDESIEDKVVRSNYEDCRKGIIDEMRSRNPDIPEDYERLP